MKKHAAQVWLLHMNCNTEPIKKGSAALSQKVNQLLETIAVLPLDDAVIAHYSEIQVELERMGARIITRAHLKMVNRDKMEQYINHHLRITGLKNSPFDEQALTAIHQGSGGPVPQGQSPDPRGACRRHRRKVTERHRRTRPHGGLGVTLTQGEKNETGRPCPISV